MCISSCYYLNYYDELVPKKKQTEEKRTCNNKYGASTDFTSNVKVLVFCYLKYRCEINLQQYFKV